MSRVALALAALAATLACSEAPRTPADVALAYFRFLGRDPIRTLPLVTGAFHVQHGLHAVSASEARALRELPRPGERAAAAGDWSLDRLQLAWLEVQSRDGFRALRERLEVTLLDVSERGERASVRVRVQPRRGAAFEQRFELVRDGTWRIDSVEQSDVARDNELAAFVAHPTESERLRLERERALGDSELRPRSLPEPRP